MSWWWLLASPLVPMIPLACFYALVLYRSGKATKGLKTYCGPGGWGDRLVPDVIVLCGAQVCLIAVCYNHDQFYKYPMGKRKWVGDYRFLGDHLRLIDVKAGRCDWKPRYRRAHQLAALIVFGAVLVLGHRAWKTARREELERKQAGEQGECDGEGKT